MKPIGKTGPASRSTRSRYESVSQFVDLANLLPAGDLPTPAQLHELQRVRATDQERWRDAEKELDSILTPMWKKALRRFPARAADGIDKVGRRLVVLLRRPEGLPWATIYAAELYTAAWVVRAALRQIATATATPGRKLKVDVHLPAAVPLLQIEPDGKIFVVMDLYRDFLLPALHRFGGNRLRTCTWCGILFIARREKQPTCTPQHGNAWRQQNWRAQQPGYHKRQKREDRRLMALNALISSTVSEEQSPMFLEEE